VRRTLFAWAKRTHERDVFAFERPSSRLQRCSQRLTRNRSSVGVGAQHAAPLLQASEFTSRFLHAAVGFCTPLWFLENTF
jgi:hypothetical protein